MQATNQNEDHLIFSPSITSGNPGYMYMYVGKEAKLSKKKIIFMCFLIDSNPDNSTTMEFIGKVRLQHNSMTHDLLPSQVT